MAQDVRPYKSKEQDGQGNEIILRDQQLVEQTSQTTMASGEYFEIVDVDGRMAKIPKDNMIGIVKDALGSLLNGLADQTTVAKFLTLNGNTLGASAAATAASVLGGQLMKISSSVTTLESLPPGIYYYDNRPAFMDSSFSDYGIIEIKGGDLSTNVGMVATLTIPGSGGVWQNILYTGKDTYRGWQRLDNFGCSTVADLASLLGVTKSIDGSNNNVVSLGTVTAYSSIRVIGSDYAESRGPIDFTIYGNGDGSLVARGRAGASDREIKIYTSNSVVYLKFSTGISVSVCIIGAYPTNSTLPSGATELSVTPYSS